MFLICPETIFINSQPTFQRQNILHIFTNLAESTSAILSHWHLFLIIISKKKKALFWRKSEGNNFRLPLSLFYICPFLFPGNIFHLFSLSSTIWTVRYFPKKSHSMILRNIVLDLSSWGLPRKKSTDFPFTFILGFSTSDIIWPCELQEKYNSQFDDNFLYSAVFKFQIIIYF